MLDSSKDCLDLELLLVPDTTLILIAAIIEPLRAANRVAGRSLYRWRLVSPDGEPVLTASGLHIPVDGVFQPDERPDPLVIVASYGWQKSATQELIRRLNQARRYRPAIIGVESGSWLMARADLLRNHSATTHWEDYEEFATRHPDIALSDERFVIDGNRITTGGSLPTVDLMLEIIRRRQGYSLALEVSRLFIYEPAPTAITRAAAPSTTGLRRMDSRVGDAARIMGETLDQPLTLATLAKRVGVTSRHLQSLFRRHIGMAPHMHYLALRLNAARRLVIETQTAFADIAPACGFSSAAAFSRRYRAQYGESPSETRRRIQAAGR